MNSTRCAIAALFSVSVAAMASAAPTTVKEVAAALEKQGAGSMQSAIMNGKPMITGRMMDTGFTAVLKTCDDAMEACQSIVFKTCHDSVGIARLDMLEIANAYNQRTFRGTAIVDETGSIGDVVCVEYEAEFPGDRTFGDHLVTNWAEAMADFEDHVRGEMSDRLAASIMAPSP